MNTTSRLFRTLLLCLGLVLTILAMPGGSADDEGEHAEPVEGLSAEEEAAIMAKVDTKVEVKDVGKENWINQELRFAAELSKMKYEDLAKTVLQRVDTGEGWGEPLTEAEKQYVKSKRIKIKFEVVMSLDDPEEKIKGAEEALADLRKMRDELPEGALRQEATIDLVEGYFRLGEEFRKTIEEAGGAVAEEGGEDNTARIGEINSQIKSINEKVFFARGKKKKELEEKIKELRKELSGLIAKSGLGGKAAGYFVQGMGLAKPLLEQIIENFDSVYTAAQEAPREKQAALNKMAETVFLRRVRLQHMMEKAYANWVFLFPRGSSGREGVVKGFGEYVETVLWDYEDFYPADKVVYIHWITMLGAQDDPIGKKGEEGKEIPPVDETNPEEGDYMRYQWPSTRAKFLFERHFVDPELPRGFGVLDSHKVKGLFYYTEALANLTRGAYMKADEAEGELKEAWQKHATELAKDALAAFNEVTQPESRLLDVTIDETTRNTARLKIGVRMHMFQAERAIKAGDKDAAAEALLKAMEQCSLVMSAGPGWKFHGQNELQNVTEFAEKHDIELTSIDAVLADAEDLMRAWKAEVKLSKKMDLLRQANAKYFEALDIAKKYEEKDKRAAYLVNICSRAGVNALRMEDYLTGYILNFFIAREFGYSDYPRDAYGSIQKTYERCLKNLRYAAGKLRKEKNTDFAKRMYVDALLLGISRTEEGGQSNPDLVVILINELKGLGLLQEALDYIGDVDKDHVYYRTTLLMGAGICQRLMTRAQDKLAKLPDPSVPPAEGKPPLPEGEALEKLKEKRAELIAEIEGFAKRAVEFSEQFLAEMDKRPPLDEARATPKEKEVYENETKNIPAALMIPMNIAFTAGDYAKVIELADQLEAKLAKVDAISEAEKKGHLSGALFLRLISQLRMKPVKEAPVEEVRENLVSAESVLPKLKAADVGDGERINKGYLLLGAAWNNLGNRYEHMAAAPPEGTSKEELQKKLKDCRVKAADLFVEAEGAVYEQLALGLKIGQIYSNQGMHEKAEAVYDIAIRYWADSEFTSSYLYQGKQTLDDLKRASVAAPVSNALGGIDEWKRIPDAASDEDLVTALNTFITTVKPGDHLDAYKTALEGALAIEGLDEKVKANVEQGLALIERPDLAETRELRQRVNRVVLEASYPEVLALSEVMSVLPTERQYDLQSGVAKPEEGPAGFGHKYPATPEGRKKAAILKAMHDPSLIVGQSDKDTIKEYIAELKGKIESAGSAAQRETFRNRLEVVQEGIRLRVYGEEQRGKIVKRSYSRALRYIETLFDFDKNAIPLERPEQVPTTPFLEDLAEALRYNRSIFSAQKRYVEALMALGKADKALVYLEGLLDLYPNDYDLKLSLARAETQIASGAKDYGTEQGQMFMRARMRILDVYERAKRTAMGGTLWWDSKMALFNLWFNEVKLRHENGKTTVDIKTPWMRLDREGNPVEVPMVTEKDLDTQAKKLMNEIQRLLSVPPAGLEISDSRKDKLNAWYDQLKAWGYKPSPRRQIEEEAKKDDEGAVTDPDGELSE